MAQVSNAEMASAGETEEWRIYRRLRDARGVKERERDELGLTTVPLEHPRHIDHLADDVRRAWRHLNDEALDLAEAEARALERAKADTAVG